MSEKAQNNNFENDFIFNKLIVKFKLFIISQFFTINAPKMASVSQFSLEFPQNQTKHLTQNKTPSTFSKLSAFNSNNDNINTYEKVETSNMKKHRCESCEEHLSNLTQVKKKQILLQYEIEKLNQEIERIKKQNKHLVSLQYYDHKVNLQKYNPSLYFKEDLQSELKEAQYMLDLCFLSNNNKNHKNQAFLSKQTNKEKQAVSNQSMEVNYKKKAEQLLFQNVKLQQRIMIKDKIIEDRNLFPLYHYDQRILMLRKNVQFWYRKAEQQAAKLSICMKEVKTMQSRLQRDLDLKIKQQRIHWEFQIKKLLFLCKQKNKNQDVQAVKASQVSNENESEKVLNDKTYTQNKKSTKFQKKAFIGSYSKKQQNINKDQRNNENIFDNQLNHRKTKNVDQNKPSRKQKPSKTVKGTLNKSLNSKFQNIEIKASNNRNKSSKNCHHQHKSDISSVTQRLSRPSCERCIIKGNI